MYRQKKKLMSYLVDIEARLKERLVFMQKENIELYEFNNNIYFTIDKNFCVQNINSKAAQFLNIDRKFIINQSFLKFLTINSQLKLNITVQTLLEKKFKQTCEIEILQKSFGKKQVSLEIMLLDNQFMRICLIDNTSMHLLEMELFELKKKSNLVRNIEIYNASRISALGELSSVFIHEISQPLTAIIAYSKSFSIMTKNILGYETFKKILIPIEQIRLQANHAWEIIENMKNFINDIPFQVEETDINVLIQEALSILNYESLNFKIKITLNFGDNLPKIKVNKIHIMQIILNLSQNSIESLQNKPENKPELIIKTQEAQGNIVIHVIDNGLGVPVEFENKIFESYFTTKPNGTGIGLRVCRSLVEAHGGKINIQKHTKNGAWFTFTLPI